MKMNCPKCEEMSSLEYITSETRPERNGQLYVVDIYKCRNCDKEYDVRVEDKEKSRRASD